MSSQHHLILFYISSFLVDLCQLLKFTQFYKKQRIPRGEGVFNVVGGGVDEDSTLIPSSTLHPDVLMNVAQTLQLTVADHDGWGTEKRTKV